MPEAIHGPLLDEVKADIETLAFAVCALPLPEEPDDSFVPALARWLDSTDLDRIAEMSSARTAAAFVVTRSLLRRVLGHILDAPPSKIELTATEQGKPALVRPIGAPIYFNVSHSRTLAMIGFSRIGEIGVDVEDVGHYRDAVARRSTTEAEYNALHALSEPERAAAFYRLWTIKEACAKATGKGISVGMNNIPVSLEGDGRWRDFVWASVALSPGTAAAVALRTPSEIGPPLRGSIHHASIEWLVAGGS
jgi:phosphopantetheine--protein transferase-like protein